MDFSLKVFFFNLLKCRVESQENALEFPNESSPSYRGCIFWNFCLGIDFFSVYMSKKSEARNGELELSQTMDLKCVVFVVLKAFKLTHGIWKLLREQQMFKVDFSSHT